MDFTPFPAGPLAFAGAQHCLWCDIGCATPCGAPARWHVAWQPEPLHASPLCETHMQVAERTYAFFDRHPFVPLLCGRPGTAYYFSTGPYDPGCGTLPDPDHDEDHHR